MMSDQEYCEALDRMRRAGGDYFNQGKPCVPGLDPLWHREIVMAEDEDDFMGWLAEDLAEAWRDGWADVAATVDSIVSKRPPNPHAAL